MDAHRQTHVMKLIADFCNFVDAAKHLYYGCIQKISLRYFYKGADKSLAQTGRKQANVSVRMA